MLRVERSAGLAPVKAPHGARTQAEQLEEFAGVDGAYSRPDIGVAAGMAGVVAVQGLLDERYGPKTSLTVSAWTLTSTLPRRVL